MTIITLTTHIPQRPAWAVTVVKDWPGQTDEALTYTGQEHQDGTVDARLERIDFSREKEPGRVDICVNLIAPGNEPEEFYIAVEDVPRLIAVLNKAVEEANAEPRAIRRPLDATAALSDLDG